MSRLRRLAVLFDLDGTLLDSVPLILASVQHAFAERARRPTMEEWIAGIGTPLRVQLQAWTDGPDDLITVVDRYRTFQDAHHDEMIRAFPGAADTVRSLHEAGRPLGIVTGKMAETAAHSLAHVGMRTYFDAIVGADSCAHHKPHPEPVLHALERLEALPQDAVFVGDSPLDVKAGNAAGVRTIAVLWGASGREALAEARPTHWLEAIGDLPALLERIAR